MCNMFSLASIKKQGGRFILLFSFYLCDVYFLPEKERQRFWPLSEKSRLISFILHKGLFMFGFWIIRSNILNCVNFRRPPTQLLSQNQFTLSFSDQSNRFYWFFSLKSRIRSYIFKFYLLNPSSIFSIP